jgi:hypothetical protein
MIMVAPIFANKMRVYKYAGGKEIGLSFFKRACPDFKKGILPVDKTKPDINRKIDKYPRVQKPDPYAYKYETPPQKPDPYAYKYETPPRKPGQGKTGKPIVQVKDACKES